MSNSALISSIMLFITEDICFDAAGTVIQEYPEGDFNLKIYIFSYVSYMQEEKNSFFFFFPAIANGLTTKKVIYSLSTDAFGQALEEHILFSVCFRKLS